MSVKSFSELKYYSAAAKQRLGEEGGANARACDFGREIGFLREEPACTGA